MVIDSGIQSSNQFLAPHLNFSDVKLHPENYQVSLDHGTHIAGLIVKDTCKEAEIISCKFFFGPGDNLGPELKCLQRALDEQFDFVNFSAGGADFDLKEVELIIKLTSNGIKVVVAAGNNDKNLGNPCIGYFPACYGPMKNLFVVGALDQKGKRLDYKFSNSGSNYGMVDMVWELGEDVSSIGFNDTFQKKSGTSQATAIFMNRLVKQRCTRIISN